MQNQLVLLDTSLRDGGHRNDFHFQPQDLAILLPALEEAKIDYIEVGYRNGPLNPTDHLGVAAWCKKDYLQMCHSYLKQSKMAVMAMSSHLQLQELDELKECGVQLLRLYGLKDQLETLLPFIQRAKDLHMEVAINLTFISHYSEEDLSKALAILTPAKPHMIYFADSNGSLQPKQVQKIYQQSKQSAPIPLGFHAHDNLGLAQSNTLAALETGATFVDATLAGMGKGIGNLKTEFFVAYLHAIGIKKYSLSPLLSASNYVRSHLGIGAEPIEINEFNKAFR